MEFLRGIEWTPLTIAKAIIIGLIVLLFASFVHSFVRGSFERSAMGGYASDGVFQISDISPSIASAPGTYFTSESAASYGYEGDMPTLSARNVAGMPAMEVYPPQPYAESTGNTAEEYEVTEYSASIETEDSDAACAQLSGLKSRSYVIFESANDHDRGCDFRFKVEKSRVPEILAFVKEFDPEDLNENTYTIKNAIDDFTSETDVLDNKRHAIDDTLKESLIAYDEITALATANQDAESLARIIDSKLQLIERLTQQRIEINTQLDRLARGKAEQLDRLAYTYFNVSAYENKYLDKEALANSWKNAVRQTVSDVNSALQAMTLGLIAFAFIVLQWIAVFVIGVLVARRLWSWVQRIWKGKPGSNAPVKASRTRRNAEGEER
ncbi:MAG: hypothetical protein WAZ27_01635 [Minisyncoccia bacterium]